MENKTARFTVLMDPLKKQAFEQLCAAQDLTPSQVTRQLIREYLEKHNVSLADIHSVANPQVKR
ncbi:CopG family transcriptional regulator [Shewanella sp. SR44-3]|uniref:CopG family transcriptional regulator n=1 Tax=unclassified Shewanella TaxID=196818 RepID=UPI0015F82B6F|nr:CopG family transcriptional regulator [Shewanella sp. SR44-3]MBB1269199.1 CopG family transcriptional regulator [Shewanella sp. SR44-3]